MTIKVALHHRTHYTFDRPVGLSPHEVRLRPAAHCRTPIESYSLNVKPARHFLNWQQDPYGNWIARLGFPEKSRELEITVDLVADMTVINPFDFFVDPSAEKFPFVYGNDNFRELAPYLELIPETPLLMAWVRKARTRFLGTPISTIDLLIAVNRLVREDVNYLVRMEQGIQTPDQTLECGQGSCRDSAWLMVQILRYLGIAARFASGYLIQLAADQKSLDGPSGPTADFTDLHAWAEAYIPGAGWIGLDPTSGLLAGEGHLPLVCSPHPSSAAPITGATDPCTVTFEFSNTVTRLVGPPRVTLPYSEEQWLRIDLLGHDVDKALAHGDVRLTVGGEPTFVSVDDMDAPEWTTAADGADKRAKAEALARRLLDRFGPGGLLHYGQGRWYPGEPLPRWQIALLWRADGHPLWHDRALLDDGVLTAGPVDPEAPSSRSDHTHAATLIRSIAAALGLPDGCCLPAYEDPLHR